MNAPARRSRPVRRALLLLTLAACGRGGEGNGEGSAQLAREVEALRAQLAARTSQDPADLARRLEALAARQHETEQIVETALRRTTEQIDALLVVLEELRDERAAGPADARRAAGGETAGETAAAPSAERGAEPRPAEAQLTEHQPTESQPAETEPTDISGPQPAAGNQAWLVAMLTAGLAAIAFLAWRLAHRPARPRPASPPSPPTRDSPGSPAAAAAAATTWNPANPAPPAHAAEGTSGEDMSTEELWAVANLLSDAVGRLRATVPAFEPPIATGTAAAAGEPTTTTVEPQTPSRRATPPGQEAWRPAAWQGAAWQPDDLELAAALQLEAGFPFDETGVGPEILAELDLDGGREEPAEAANAGNGGPAVASAQARALPGEATAAVVDPAPARGGGGDGDGDRNGDGAPRAAGGARSVAPQSLTVMLPARDPALAREAVAAYLHSDPRVLRRPAPVLREGGRWVEVECALLPGLLPGERAHLRAALERLTTEV